MFSDFCLSFAVYLYYYFGHHFVEFNCRAGLETHSGLVVPCDEVLIYCSSANSYNNYSDTGVVQVVRLSIADGGRLW